MSSLGILFSLIKSISTIGLVAYLLGRTVFFREIVSGKRSDFLSRALATGFFGLLAITGTYLGVTVSGAIANSRSIGAVVGGALAGPWVGLGAGLLAGLHRYSLGGFTALPCGLSPLVAGLAGGMVYRFNRGRRPTPWQGALAAFITELIQRFLVLWLAKPFEAAWQLELLIGGPMLLVNSLGAAVFLLIVNDIQRQLERNAAIHVGLALDLANRALPYLRRGLTPESASFVANEVLRLTGAAAVALLDSRGELLAAAPQELSEKTVQTLQRTGRQVLEPAEGATEGTTSAVLDLTVTKITTLLSPGETDRRGAGGGETTWRDLLQREMFHGRVALVGEKNPLVKEAEREVIAAPIAFQERHYGVLVLLESSGQQVDNVHREVVLGVGGLLARQIRISELEAIAALHAQAQLQMLQAQINPHFLFNALSTIISLCRLDALRARDLLIHLAHFLRKTLSSTGQFVSLDEEMKTVEAYLLLEQARFGQRLQVHLSVDPRAKPVAVPNFLLQPLVENAVRHGLLPREGPGHLTITVDRTDEAIKVCIADDGVGIPPQRLREIMGKPPDGRRFGLGLYNVNERLKRIYGPEYGLHLESEPGRGTTVTFEIPDRFRPGQSLEELY